MTSSKRWKPRSHSFRKRTKPCRLLWRPFNNNNNNKTKKNRTTTRWAIQTLC